MRRRLLQARERNVLIDDKQPPVIRDGALLKRLHLEWLECALCHCVGIKNHEWLGLSLHHVCNHPRDDVRGNLVMLCGDGVRGCHGRITVNDVVVLRLLAEHIYDERPDVLAHLEWRHPEEGADAWIARVLRLELAPG